MIKEILYKGPLVTDTSIPGETKADGIVPAHGNVIQLSRKRWAIFIATKDPSGWDATRSIVYQVRGGSPDGTLLKEGRIQSYRSGWDPFDEGVSLRKSHGAPIAFGVPSGAVHQGKRMPNENVFVLKWSIRTLLERDGRLLTPELHADQWPEGHTYVRRLYRIEWLQFRLNDNGDDIEILQPISVLRQKGYEAGEAYCSLAPDTYMNHVMTPPVPEDASCTVWLACDTFGPVPGQPSVHGRIAPVAFEWNGATGLYEWTRTGPLTGIPGILIGESSISRIEDSWIVAARCFKTSAATAWYRTDDLFAGLGEPVMAGQKKWQSPRHSYRCADDELRIFLNNRAWSPQSDRRNPLFAIDVDPKTFAYNRRRVVCDARLEGLPFDSPYLDMSKLCPNQGNRQLIIFRTIDQFMTSSENFRGSDQERAVRLAPAGIHHAEILYHGRVADAWEFSG
jgi:hypothetical protein